MPAGSVLSRLLMSMNRSARRAPGFAMKAVSRSPQTIIGGASGIGAQAAADQIDGEVASPAHYTASALIGSLGGAFNDRRNFVAKNARRRLARASEGDILSNHKLWSRAAGPSAMSQVAGLTVLPAFSPYIVSGVANPDRVVHRAANITNSADKALTEYLTAESTGDYLGDVAKKVTKKTLDDKGVRDSIKRELSPVSSAMKEVGAGLGGSLAGTVVGDLIARAILPTVAGDQRMTKEEFSRRQRNRNLLRLLLGAAGSVAGYTAGSALASKAPSTEVD